MSSFKEEAKTRWGDTAAYYEYEKKTADYKEDKWQEVNNGLNFIFIKFSDCFKNGNAADSEEAQKLVKELQDYISANYYSCTNEILSGLGQMYVADERFKQNIDANGIGTAEFSVEAIKIYCK